MATGDYAKAHKLGKKEYQNRMLHNQKPTLQVLEEMIEDHEKLTKVPLGLVQIPIEQIAGTRYGGRSNAFASNFMPIMKSDSEFAAKWERLCNAHENEGITDPIKVVEYMNKFYVEEGNKRVSVMKFFEAKAIPGYVTRLMPPKSNEKENKIYYEFVEFYNLSKINYISFTKLGSYAKLQEIWGKQPEEKWSSDERLRFSAVYNRFVSAYESNGGKRLSITAGDAFLAFIKLHGIQVIKELTMKDMKHLVEKTWEEFTIQEQQETLDLRMDPAKSKSFSLRKLLPTGKSKLKIAFIHEKNTENSAWVYAHELGRKHLEDTFPDEVTTLYAFDVSKETIEEVLETVIEEKCNIIFVTTPAFAEESVKAAIANPDVRILNCSLNTSHRYIRTYYPRMHEAKFLMGAVAGAMAENDRIFYLADYPLLGTIAYINAFALGAKMVNPRATVYLDWSTKKYVDVMEGIKKYDTSCASLKDMVVPEEAFHHFGICHVEDDHIRKLAMPLCDWGLFYEKLIRAIMDGSWNNDNYSNKAVNYWWGMSSGVVDVAFSKNIPLGTKRLVELLRDDICNGYNPFSGVLYSQHGVVEGSDDNSPLSPERIVKMDWLAENIVGSIPDVTELKETAVSLISQQGLQVKDV